MRQLNQLLTAIYDTQKIDSNNLKLFYTLQSIFLVGVVLLIIYIPAHYYFHVEDFIVINLIAAGLLIVAIKINTHGYHSTSTLVASATTIAHISTAIYYYGWDCGFQYYLLPIGPVFLLHLKESIFFRLSGIILSSTLLLLLHQMSLTSGTLIKIPVTSATIINDLNLLS